MISGLVLSFHISIQLFSLKPFLLKPWVKKNGKLKFNAWGIQYLKKKVTIKKKVILPHFKCIVLRDLDICPYMVAANLSMVLEMRRRRRDRITVWHQQIPQMG